jgi:hypothetical protein
MAVVDAQRVNRYLSEPFWTESQWAEAEALCVEKEDELAARLITPITPITFEEVATVLDSGLVATTYPVVAVTTFLGEPVDEDHPLPEGWALINSRVRLRPANAVLPVLGALGMTSFWQVSFGAASRIQGGGQVNIAYQAGWGAVPALVNAILRKVAAIMKNRHDDTLITDDAGSATGKQTPTVVEEWTDTELMTLGIFRNPRGMAWR